MTLQHLRETLLQEARQEAETLLRSAEEEARQLVQEERNRGQARKKQTGEELKNALLIHRRERLAWAQLEARRIAAEAAEDAMKAVLDDIYELLGSRRDVAYYEFLNRMVATGMKEMGEGAVVHTAKADGVRLRMPPKTVVKTDQTAGLGGVLVTSKEGKIQFNGTLETRLEMLHEELRKRIYQQLSVQPGKAGGKSKR